MTVRTTLRTTSGTKIVERCLQSLSPTSVTGDLRLLLLCEDLLPPLLADELAAVLEGEAVQEGEAGRGEAEDEEAGVAQASPQPGTKR